MASDAREVWGDLATSAFVQSSHLFKSLDEEAMQDLLKLASCVTYAAGEPIVREGDAGDEFFLIKDGVAAVTAQKNGTEHELGHLDKGAFFGEYAVLTGKPRMATVTARTEVTAVRFPAPMIAAFAERFPKVKKLLDAVKAAREKDAEAKLSA